MSASTEHPEGTMDPAHLRTIVRDDVEVIQGLCPGCNSWADLDGDQLFGKVSTHHDTPECGYHETKNWYADHGL